MALPSDGAPLVSGSSSAPVTPTSVDSLAAILYGTKGTSSPTVPDYTMPGTSSQQSGLEQLLQNPATGANGPASQAGINQAVKIANQQPASSAVKTVAIGTMPSSGGGGSSGLASPSALSQLAALAGGAAPVGDSKSQATTLVNAQFQPILDELNRQLAEDQAVYGQQSDQVKADQARLDSNAATIYGLLHNQFGELQNQSDQQYGQTEGKVGNSFDQLMSRLNSIYGGAGQQLQGDLNQLGLPAGTADNFGNHSLVDNYNLLTGLANTDKTATMGNLTTEGQGFHTLLGDQARQATATGDDQQSTIDTLAMKELTQLKNNLQNQLDQINKQKANINTEKGQQIAAETLKLQQALAQTNNQLAIQEAKLAQGAQRIDISRQSLAQRINQNTFSDQLALQKLNKAGGTANQNKTKLGQAETTLNGLIPNTTESASAFNFLTGGSGKGGTTASGVSPLTLLLTKGAGAIPVSDLQSEANTLAGQYGGDPGQILEALKLALLSLGGYGTP